jgi:DNA recombination protein RmuC
MDTLYLIMAFILGALFAALLVYNRFLSSNDYISVKAVNEKYVFKEIFNELQNQLDNFKNEIEARTLKIIDLNKDLASQEQININLDEKLASQKEELTSLQKRFQIEFENIANRLLEEKGQRFSQQNHSQLNDLLNPLRDKIKDFELNIERKFIEETQQRTSLKTEIENLRQLNQQLSQDANNLVSALRGDSKTQGDWGELQLELLLEKAGLLRGVHFHIQNSFADQNGAQKRPDFIIQLPDNKQVVIDSKVSLTAYEQFFNAQDTALKPRFLKAHNDSLRNHVKGLSDKSYEQLYQINSPDYVIMFVPIEPALNVALQEDTRLFTDALEKNVVIVTATTLLATMRTVSFIWKQENQKKNVLEIARQSGMLYDKFVAFLEDLKGIGLRLDSAQTAYQDAMNKLNDSRKYGDTLIGRAEKIRELGAKASKKIPKDMLDDDVAYLVENIENNSNGE